MSEVWIGRRSGAGPTRSASCAAIVARSPETGYGYIRTGAALDAEALVGQLKTQIANYKVPKRAFIVTELPLQLPCGEGEHIWLDIEKNGANTAYVAQQLALAAGVQDKDVILADCERVIGRYHDLSEGAMTQVALAPCAPFNVTKQLMIETAQLAEKHNCRLHTHLAETRDEVDYCNSRWMSYGFG